MEDDDLKVDPVFASHNIMIKDCEKNNIIPMIVYFFPFFLSYTAILLLKAPTTYFYTIIKPTNVQMIPDKKAILFYGKRLLFCW